MQKKNHLTFTCLCLFIIFIFCLVSSIYADDNLYTLDEFVVTATRVEEPKKEIPASIQLITEDDIKYSVSKNAGDLISEASLGHVHKYPDLSVSSISLRGFRTDLFDELKSRVLVLINGHRIGNVNISKISIDDVEKIEIIKGPSSVMYGSSAMGGVINIITKQGKEEGVHGKIGGEAGSWGYWKTDAELSGKKNKFDYYLMLSQSSRDDYSAKDYGRIQNTQYKDESISMNFGYSFFEKDRIFFKYQHWRGWEIGSPGPVYEHDSDDYSDRRRDNIEVGYKTDSFTINYYYNFDSDEFHEGKITGQWDIPNTVNKKDVRLQGLNIQKTFDFEDYRMVVGSQWDRFEIDNSINIGTPYNPNSKYDSYGFFTEGRLGFFEKKLLISTGIRYDYFENEILKTKGFKNLKPKEENFDNITFRGGVVYQISDRFKIRGSLGTAFRAPAPDEVATDYYGSWGIRWLGNPHLKPEKSITYDIGSDYKTEQLEGSLTFFHTEFSDKIMSYYNESKNAMTFKNVSGATFEGFEGNVSHSIDKLLGLKKIIKVFCNFTYLTRYTSKDKYEISRYGKTLLYIPRWTAGAGIRAGNEKWDIRLIATYNGDEKIQDWAKYPFPVVKKGDFTVVNTMGCIRPLKNVEMTLSVENLLNRKYEYVKYYPMQSRTFIFGLNWIF